MRCQECVCARDSLPIASCLLCCQYHSQRRFFSSPEEDAEEREQQKTALQLEIDDLRRTQNVLFPLIKAATALCGSDAAWSYGFGLAGRDRFKGDLKTAAPLLGFDNKVKVLYVANASPAEQAGLRAGDNVRELLGVQGEDEWSVAKVRNVSALMGQDESSLFVLQWGIATKQELRQADEYAMTLMRRAGYDASIAPRFWRRLLVSIPELETDKSWGTSLRGADRLARMQTHAGTNP